MRGSSAIERLLRATPAPKLQVFVVWEPILPTDWFTPTSGTLARISDPRAVQFWDHDHVVSRLLSSALPAGQPTCCRRRGALWDDIVLFPADRRLGVASPSWISGPIVDSTATLRQQLAASAP